MTRLDGYAALCVGLGLAGVALGMRLVYRATRFDR